MYVGLADWEASRDPGESCFWVHPDHIALPELIDIDGARFTPVEIRYCPKVGHIWTGLPMQRPKGRARAPRGIVLTQKLAAFLHASIDVPMKDLGQLDLPLPDSTVQRLRLRAIAYYKPDLMAFKSDVQEERRTRRQTPREHMEDAIIMDAFGEEYRISTIGEGPEGDILLRGRRVGLRNAAGHQLIPTHEIIAVMQTCLTRKAR